MLKLVDCQHSEIQQYINALYESCNGEVDIGFWHFKEKNATFTFEYNWFCSIPFAKR